MSGRSALSRAFLPDMMRLIYSKQRRDKIG